MIWFGEKVVEWLADGAASAAVLALIAWVVFA
jgi:hypothetical protein